MSLEDKIKKAEEEEVQSHERYMMMAHEAEGMGLHNMAGMMEEIASDEGRHAQVMRGMMKSGMMGGEMHERMMGSESYYWEVTNMVTGLWMQYHAEYPTTDQALQAAKVIYADTYPEAVSDHLVIKIFGKSPEARTGLTYEPIVTESYWISGEQPGSSRSFPRTYMDWIDLAEGMKAKYPDGSAMRDYVNFQMGHIAREVEYPAEAQEAKRWFVEKAGELGITKS